MSDLKIHNAILHVMVVFLYLTDSLSHHSNCLDSSDCKVRYDKIIAVNKDEIWHILVDFHADYLVRLGYQFILHPNT